MLAANAAATCRWHAAEAERQAAQISDRHLKAIYARIADQWSVLARSYEFAESAERFLLEAKRARETNPAQPSRELVLLTSSFAKPPAAPVDPAVNKDTARVAAEKPARQGDIAA